MNPSSDTEKEKISKDIVHIDSHHINPLCLDQGIATYIIIRPILYWCITFLCNSKPNIPQNE